MRGERNLFGRPNRPEVDAHAGVLDAQGRVVNPTRTTPALAYFGVVFHLETVTATVNARGTGIDGFDDGSMLDDWRRKWPILQRPFHAEEIAPSA